RLREAGGEGDFADIRIFPNSLNRHILRMRDAGVLDGLPYWAPHLTRSAMGDFIAERVSGVVSSLVPAHTLPADADEAAQTTRTYYLTSQRMAEKASGMRAWSEALMDSYLRHGGKTPEPAPIVRKLKRKPR